MGEINHLHLHRLPAQDLAQRAVSAVSCWKDPKWIFDAEHPPQAAPQRTITWPQDLPAGLIDVAKRLVWSMRVDPPQGNVHHKNRTSSSFARYFICVIRWMMEPRQRFLTFASLDPAACIDYRNDVAARYHDRHGRGMNAKGLCPYLEPIVALYRQRSKLPDAIVVEPFNGKSAFEAAAPIVKGELGWIPYVDDDIAVPTIMALIEWVDQRAPDIIRAEKARRAIVEQFPVRVDYRSMAYRKLCETFTFSTPADASLPWHPQLKSAMQIGGLIKALEIAAGSLILAMVGMRMHELLSLQDDCIEIEPSVDGTIEIFYIKGQTAKLETTARDVRWAAGARPAGSSHRPEPIRAVDVLIELFRELRAASGCRSLFLTGHSKFAKPSNISCMNTSTFTVYFDKFYQRWAAPPRSWRFSTHQWRKTFARFVARTDKAAGGALANHFQHMSFAMTDRGYIGRADLDLLEYVDSVHQAETAEALMHMLDGKTPLSGKMGERLEALRAQFRGITLAARSEEIAWLISESDISIHACDWGWCVYRQETSRCEGSADAPSEARRGPSVCAECSNLAVDQRHRNFWQSRHDRNCALLEQLKDAPPLRRVVPQERAQESKKVLDKLARSLESGNG